MIVTPSDYFSEGSGIVTLCGSTKYFFETQELNRILTFSNWIVLQCGSWGHSFSKYARDLNKDYSVVKKLHFQKILMSQCIVVVSDSSGYIGSSTKAEIAFAQSRNIPVFYYDGETITGHDFTSIPDTLTDTSIIDAWAVNNTLGY